MRAHQESNRRLSLKLSTGTGVGRGRSEPFVPAVLTGGHGPSAGEKGVTCTQVYAKYGTPPCRTKRPKQVRLFSIWAWRSSWTLLSPSGPPSRTGLDRVQRSVRRPSGLSLEYRTEPSGLLWTAEASLLTFPSVLVSSWRLGGLGTNFCLCFGFVTILVRQCLLVCL